MPRVRFIMLGGFLGAGKTTALGRLIEHYRRLGRRVAAITNDQAPNLVDTQTLSHAGAAVAEVAGACFCCNFGSLLERAHRLIDEERPDILLAEPVGSCTDLVATVVQPLKRFYGDEFEISPYVVLLKSEQFPSLAGDSPFSPDADYIFRKQLEEADAIAISKADELSEERIAEIETELRSQLPNTPVFRLSSKTGVGLDELISLLDRQGPFGRKLLELDYDRYAAGEAELGWLNAVAAVAAERAIAIDGFVESAIAGIRERLRRDSVPAAHVKISAVCDGRQALFNLSSTNDPVRRSSLSRCSAPEFQAVVNARAAADPEYLKETVKAAMEEAAKSAGASCNLSEIQAFRPGRPVPTYRMTEVI